MRAIVLPALLAACWACGGASEETRGAVTRLDAAGMKLLVERSGAESVTKLQARPLFHRRTRPGESVQPTSVLACGAKEGWWGMRDIGASAYILDMTDVGHRLFDQRSMKVEARDGGKFGYLSTPTRGRYENVGAFEQANPGEKTTTYEPDAIKRYGYVVDTISPFYATSATYILDSPYAAELGTCGLQVETTAATVGKLYVQFAKKSFADEWWLYALSQQDVSKSTAWQ